MSDRTSSEPRAGRRGLLDAPERGSADELMDHGAAGELGPMRHSAAHVLAEAVLDLFPGTKLGIGPVIDDGFYYDFLLPRPLTPDDLPAIEARMRECIAADHPFELSEMTPAEARALLVERDQPFKVEIVDDLARRRGARRHADAADDLLPPGTVHRPVPRPARREHRQDRPVQAPWHGRRVLARRREAPDAPARLRHGLGDAGRPRRYLWRREEAKKRDHRRLGVQLDLFSFHDVSPGSAFWHPKGQLIWRTLETAMRELQERRGYEEVSTPILVSHRVWQTVGSLGLLPRQHVRARYRWPALLAQADELP